MCKCVFVCIRSIHAQSKHNAATFNSPLSQQQQQQQRAAHISNTPLGISTHLHIECKPAEVVVAAEYRCDHTIRRTDDRRASSRCASFEERRRPFVVTARASFRTTECGCNLYLCSIIKRVVNACVFFVCACDGARVVCHYLAGATATGDRRRRVELLGANMFTFRSAGKRRHF